MPEDFYDLLDLSEEASRDDVSNAYRSMVREYHPDNNDDPAAKEQFKTIRIARDTLLEDRDRYDAYGHVRYVEQFIDLDLDGFEFTADAESRDNVPTPSSGSASSSDQSSPTPRGPAADTEVAVDNSEDDEEATIDVEADEEPVSEPRAATREGTTEDTTKDTTKDTTSSSSSATPDPEVTTTPSDEIVFKPKPDPSLVNMCWLVVATLAAYLVGIGDFLRDNRGAVRELLSASPLTTERFGLETMPTLVESVIASPLSDPLAILVPLGLVFLPLAIAVTVARFGRGRTVWLYVLGALGPAALAAYEFAVASILPAGGFAVYVVLPLLVTGIFISDILGSVIRRYIRYYRKKLLG